MRWMDNVADDLRTTQVSEWSSKAKDRMLWRPIVEGAKAVAAFGWFWKSI